MFIWHKNWNAVKFRFIKFPARVVCGIIVGGGITLAMLRLQNWYVLKRKLKINPIQEIQGKAYNTQSKNPIMLNVKGKFSWYHIFSTIMQYDLRLQSESARLNALRLNERVSDWECKATRKKTKRKDAEITELNSK